MIPAPETQSARRSGQNESLGCVLIVDDDPIARAILRHICESIGSRNIVEAEDGLAALEAVGLRVPDLVILDIMMPRLDGMETCRRLRAAPETVNVPILMQTAVSTAGVHADCFRAGATDVVTKPVNYDETRARVLVHLQNRLLMRSLEAFQHRLRTHLALAEKFARNLQPSADSLSAVERQCGLSIEAVSRSAEEIGGDFWRLRERPDGKVIVLLGDAVGHGLAAAINAFRVDAVLSGLQSAAPDRLVADLDARLFDIDDGQLTVALTVVCYDCRLGEATVCSLGAPPALHCTAGGATPVNSGGLPAGTGLVEPRVVTVRLAIGDAILLYTDGWADGDPAAAAGLITAMAAIKGSMPDLSSLVSGAASHDDATILRLTRKA